MPTKRLKHPVMILFIWVLLRSVLLLSILPALGQGQITLDGSLGPRGPLAGPNYRIDANVGQIRGSNLFHSFGQFNVRTDESATFAGPNTITNVVGRVTGGEQSFIDGRLRSEIAGANLFLLNPSGVLFGPNAKLDVGGSFHISTADFLRFADGAKFFANLGQESVLTVASPAAFGFLGNNPAAITINGSSLKVSEGKALSAVGGDITIIGNGPLMGDSAPTLGASGGRIQLASVASPGEVVFSRLDLAPDLQVDSFTRLGRLELSRGAFLDASGNGGGSALLRSGRLRVDGAWIFADNTGPVHGAGLGVDLQVAGDAVLTNKALLTADSLGAGRARDLQLNVGTLTLTGGAQIASSARSVGRGGDLTVFATEAIAIAGQNSGLFNNTFSLGDAGRLSLSTPLLTMDSGLIQANAGAESRGNAGSIAVQAGRLTLNGGAQIDSGTQGSGRGGEVSVVASEAIAIRGSSSGLFSNTFSLGDAGRLVLSAPTLSLDNGALIQALAAERSGGNAGNLDVRVGRLTLSGGAQLDSSTRSSGRGGTLTVAATDTISIAGRDTKSNNPSGLFGGRLSISAPLLVMDAGLLQTVADRDNHSNIGGLDVRVGRLTLTRGAQISSSTTGASRGGDITVVATDGISISGSASGLVSRTLGSGDAGRLSLSTPLLTMDGGLIRASSIRGNAGSIAVQAGRLTLSGGAEISSSTAGEGRGGDVSVVATDGIAISGSASGLFSRTLGSGDAGRLSLSTPLLTMDGGLIQASAELGSRGNAGSIEVQAGRLTLSGGAQINSSTVGASHGGDVTVVATDSIAISGSPGSLSGLFSSTLGSGDAGRLSLSTPLLSMDGGMILASSVRGNAGSIEVQAGRLTLSGGALINSITIGESRGGDVTVVATDGIAISGSASGLFSITLGSGDAGRLSLSTPLLTMDGGASIIANTMEGSRGNAGEINVEAGRVTLTGGAAISSLAAGSGKGGSVTVSARESVLIAGNSAITSFAAGDPGHLSLSAPTVIIDGGIVGAPSIVVGESFGGAAGNTSVKADNLILSGPARIITSTTTDSNGGNITIETGRLALSGGARILSGSGLPDPTTGTTLVGRGAAGNVIVAATEAVSLSGENSGLRSGTLGSGSGGKISISTPELRLDDQAFISSGTEGTGQGGSISIATPRLLADRSRITADTRGAGRGGDIQVQVGTASLASGAQISSNSFGSGQGGNVTVAATDSISLLGADGNFPSGLFSDADAGGDAGNILVRAGRLSLTNGAQMSSGTSGGGRGGSVTIAATDEISIAGRTVEGIPSGLFSNADASGDAGRLSITTPRLLLADRSRIAADTRGAGRGGDIQVQVGTASLASGAQISSNSLGSGQGGNVTVAATDSIALVGADGNFPSGLFSDADAGGDAGNILVRAGRLSLTNGAQMSSSTSGGGRGGTVTIAATDEISIAGRTVEGIPSGLFSNADASGDAGRLSISVPMLSMDGGRILARTLGAGNAGDIDVRVDKLSLTGGAQIFNGTGNFVNGVVTGTDGPGRGGNLTIMATDSIAIGGRDSDGFVSGLISSAQFGQGNSGNLSIRTPTLELRDRGLIAAEAFATSSGNAGDIDVRVGRLSLTDGAQMSSSTSGGGRGGTVTIAATDEISIAGRTVEGIPSGLFSNADASGDAGRLSISVPMLSMDGGRILARTLGAGNAGDIDVTVDKLSLTGGAQIFNGTGNFVNGVVTGTDGPGRGGNLTIMATDSIAIGGRDSDGFVSGLFSSAQIGRGNSGNLSIRTPTLELRDRGLIAAEAFATSSGNAGDIDVQVGRLALTGGAQITSSSFGTGRGGNVTIAATDQLELSAGGTISARSTGRGDAGSIVIQAGNIFRSRNGAVTTEAEQADGGNIQLTVGSMVDLRDSQLTATVKSGVGKGGNITIDPRFVILEGSQIRADAFGGPGGNVRIVSDVFLRDPASLVSASSALGIQGTVDIRAPVTSLSGVVAPLPQAFVSAAELLPARCAVRLSGGRYSSLVLGGRDGLPLDPAGVLPSPLEPDESVVDPSVTGKPNQQKTPAKFTLLAVADKVFPRLYGGNLPWRCSK